MMRASCCLQSLLLIACCGGCSGTNDKLRNRPTDDDELEEIGNVETTDDTPKRPAKRLALLIGCSKYDHLPEFASLRGPSNDVQLMSRMLRERFKFKGENIWDLVEDTDNRPTRDNIENAFQVLIDDVVAGDEVVIYLSGHGSQQPDDDPENSDDPEPDGMDEVFCPADIKPGIEDNATTIPNGISDDELRRWTDTLREKGALLWVIVDACHSGTVTRGTEVARQLRPEQLLSRDVLASARPAAAGIRGIQSQQSAVDEAIDPGGMVAIYASQPDEPTFEMPLPHGADEEDQKWYGILTYTIVQVLTESPSSMTYSELIQRVHAEYVTAGRFGPTPLIEGADRHREVLGQTEHVDRSRWLLESGPDDELRVAVGRLHGLTRGSILAVYPPPGEKGENKLLGHVRLTRVGSVNAIVEPCGYGHSPLEQDLPLGGRSKLAFLDYGKLRLKVGLDATELNPDEVARWRVLLQRLAKGPRSVFVYEETLSQANWLVRPGAHGRIELSPTASWDEQLSADDQRFGTTATGNDAEIWLTNRLGRIARAQNLLKVADFSLRQRRGRWLTSLLGKQGPTVGLKAELVRLTDENDKTGSPVDGHEMGEY
jgi:hypothetical protein